MKFTTAALGLAATVAAIPQAASDNLRPDAKAPEGCKPDFDGKFELSIFKLAKREMIAKRDVLTLTLKNGVLKDAQDRTGAIVANYQFQFDGPPQAGSIYTAGFSACNNGSLAIGGSTVFYQCLSGEFYNLYDRHWAAQCEPIAIVIKGQNQAANNNGGQADNGKKTVGTSMMVTTIVTAIGDGQPQVHTTQVPVPLCQIGDGQIQAHTTPCDKVPNNPPVSQIGDGQIQAPTKVPVITQIGDGQIQAPTGGAPVTQIGDGQVQAPSATGKPVSQIGDGQVQAPTGGKPVSQIGDGQVQAPTGAPVSQISDGQVQAPTGKPSTVPTAGAARGMPAVGALLAAGMAAVFFL